MLSATSTEWAPWYVIPADRKWFARIGAAAVIVDTLMRIDPQYPVVGEEQHKELEAVQARARGRGARGRAPDPFEAEQAAEDAEKAAEGKGGKKGGKDGKSGKKSAKSGGKKRGKKGGGRG